ncbi:MAG: hypothetical protein M1148_02720 [Candidatus Thermoplasmatota archaeon]|nr:hypothetical protein [Candidatus Thermoplasmatota archaeon]
MIIAVPVNGEVISGPGEARQIMLLDSESGYSEVSRYDNPAVTAARSPGIAMVQSVLEHNASALLVTHIGPHAFMYAKERIMVLAANSSNLQESIAALKNGSIHEAQEPLGGHHHH